MKKYLGLDDISNVNCASVLKVIKDAGEISRKDISAETGLSWAGMSKIVNKLFEKELIEERRCEDNLSGAGRTPHILSIRRDRNVIIGLDINREGLCAVVINLIGEIKGEYISELKYGCKKELIDNIIIFVEEIIRKHEHENIMSIGVAMQGELDAENGISRKFPYCKDWNNVPIKEILMERFGYKIFIEHDPNCILYEKISEGEEKNTILFRVDRSIGMAVYIDGTIIKGDGLWEVKNCVVTPKDCDKNIEKYTLEEVVADCMVDKKLNEKVIYNFIRIFTNFIYNMAQIFNASRIIVTGELIKHKKGFEEELLREFQKYDID